MDRKQYKNWKKIKSRIDGYALLKVGGVTIVALFVFAWLYFLLPSLTKSLDSLAYMRVMRLFYDTMVNKQFLCWSSFIVLLVVIGLYLWARFCRVISSIWESACLMLVWGSLVPFFWSNHWNYASINFNFASLSFQTIFLWSCILASLAEFLILCCQRILVGKRMKEDKDITSTKGYVVDTAKEYSKIAQSIVTEVSSRILSSDFNEESFAIGIVGSWGSGKTSYLNLFEERLTERTAYMNFSPWLCSSPDHIVKEYFQQLSTFLATKQNIHVEKPMRDYVKRLVSVGTEIQLSKIVSLNLTRESNEEYESLHSELKTALQKLPRKIVIAIDDIDRLDKDELVEVFRLVRNTANFPNIVYLVAYDRDYVLHQLEQAGIYDGARYIEKIFQLEVCLPKVLVDDLMGVLYQDLEEMNEHSIVDELREKIHTIPQGNYLITHLLRNYRGVKRFARQFSDAVSVAYGNLQKDGIRNFDVIDLFLIELVKYADWNLYRQLYDDPNTLLRWNDKLRDNAVMQEAYRKMLSPDYTGEMKYNKYALKVLAYLFPSVEYRSSDSINKRYNFNRYFTLGTEPGRVYLHEMKSLLNMQQEAIDQQFTKWFDTDSADKRNIRSLYVLLRDYSFNINEIPLEQWHAYVYMIVSLLNRDVNDAHSLITSTLSNFSEVNDDLRRVKLKRVAIQVFEGKINGHHAQDYAQVLSYLLSLSVLTVQEVEPLLRRNFDLYVNTYHPDSVDMIRTDSVLSNVFRKSCYRDTCEGALGDVDYGPWECLILDQFIAYFSNHKSDNEAIFLNHFNFDDDLAEGVPAEDVEQRFNDRIAKTFLCYDFYNLFCSNCLHKTEKRVDSVAIEKEARSLIHAAKLGAKMVKKHSRKKKRHKKK